MLCCIELGCHGLQRCEVDCTRPWSINSCIWNREESEGQQTYCPERSFRSSVVYCCGGQPGDWLYPTSLYRHHTVIICRCYRTPLKHIFCRIIQRSECTVCQYSLYPRCVSVNPPAIPGLRWWDPWPSLGGNNNRCRYGQTHSNILAISERFGLSLNIELFVWKAMWRKTSMLKTLLDKVYVAPAIFPCIFTCDAASARG